MNTATATQDTIRADARRVFLGRLERQVDPEGRLSAGERALRAESARRAHFRALAYRRTA